MNTNNTAPVPARPPVARSAAGVHGEVTSGRQAVPGVALTMTDHVGAQVARTRSGPDGRFEFAGVDSGTYVLIASREGYRPQAESVVLDGGSVASVHVRLDAAASVQGTVQDRHSDVPVAAAAVTVVDSGGDVIASTVSNPHGRYRISGMSAGTVTLVVAAAAADPVARVVRFNADGGDSTQEVDLAVDTYTALTGTVVADGRAVADLPLNLHDQYGRTVGTAITDANGAYGFDRVKPGDYTLRSTTGAPRSTTLAPEATNADITLATPD